MKPQRDRLDRDGIPYGRVAVCLLCKQSFKTVRAYYWHRDISVPAAQRVCRTHQAKAPSND